MFFYPFNYGKVGVFFLCLDAEAFYNKPHPLGLIYTIRLTCKLLVWTYYLASLIYQGKHTNVVFDYQPFEFIKAFDDKYTFQRMCVWD